MHANSDHMMWWSIRYSATGQPVLFTFPFQAHLPFVASKPRKVAAAAGTARSRLGARPLYSALLLDQPHHHDL
jgi:hypothetical protein